jgi:hypothetical protein
MPSRTDRAIGTSETSELRRRTLTHLQTHTDGGACPQRRMTASPRYPVMLFSVGHLTEG